MNNITIEIQIKLKYLLFSKNLSFYSFKNINGKNDNNNNKNMLSF
jgi:hypothetical protein